MQAILISFVEELYMHILAIISSYMVSQKILMLDIMGVISMD